MTASRALSPLTHYLATTNNNVALTRLCTSRNHGTNALRVASTTRERLARQILLDLEAPESYIVYGDWLEAQGDPRGRLIGIQAAKLDRDTEELRTAESELFAAHPEWLPEPKVGSTPEVEWSTPEVEWFLGFWQSLFIGQPWNLDPLEPHVLKALNRESARFIRKFGLHAGLADSRELIEFLAGHPTIEMLDLFLGSAPDDELFRSFGRLPGLMELRVSSCERVTSRGIDELRPLHRLETLDLGNLTLDDNGAHCLLDFPLKSLFVKSGLTSRGVADLANLPLTHLCLSSAFDDECAMPLGHHPTLIALELRCSTLTSHGTGVIGSITQLKRLDLFGGSLDDAGVEPLQSLASIHTLDLGHCKALTSGACTSLGRLGTLRRLSLWGSVGILGEGLIALRTLSDLQVLDLGFLELVTGDLEALLVLSKLEELSLANTGTLDDESVELLCGLENLQTLDLAHSAITESSIDRLSRLRKLRALGLHGCQPSVVEHAASFDQWQVIRDETIDLDFSLDE